jgi:hypothetical protein
MATAPIFPGALKTSTARIQNSDSTNLVTVLTPPTTGSKVVAIMVTSDDTSARDLQLVITKSGVDYPIGTTTIAITAGTIAATAAVNMLDTAKLPGLPVDRDGQRYLLLESGAVLKAKVLVAVTAAKFVNIVALHSDF